MKLIKLLYVLIFLIIVPLTVDFLMYASVVDLDAISLDTALINNVIYHTVCVCNLSFRVL